MPRKRSNLSRYSRNAKRMRLLRTEESEEDREARLTAARERQARTRASETPTQREYRLSIQRARTATYRSRESNEQRKERLSACRQRMALSRKLKLSQDMSNATRFCDMARSIFITNGIDVIKEEFTSDAFETVLHNGDNEFSFDMEGAIGKVPLKPFLQNGDDEFSIDIKDVIKREIVEFSETNSLSHIPVQQKPCEYAETFAENKVPLPEANVDVKAETNCEFFDPILENKDEIFLNEARVDVKAEIDHGFSEPILENKAEIFLNEVRADVKAETDNEFLETVSENKHGIFLQENLNEGHTISTSFSRVLDGIKQEAAVNDPLENILDIPERTSSNVEDEIDYFVVAKEVTEGPNGSSDDQSAPNEHRWKLERQFTCEKCQKAFNAGSKLFNHYIVEHQMKKEDVRPFVCKRCPRRFSLTSSLARHSRTHDEAGLNICPYCGRDFISKKDLKDHYRSRCNIRRFRCEFCNKAYRARRDFEIHMAKPHPANQGETKHTCQVCSMGYYTKRELIKHMDLHADRNLYQCYMCNQKYINKSSVVRHLKFDHFVDEEIASVKYT